MDKLKCYLGIVYVSLVASGVIMVFLARQPVTDFRLYLLRQFAILAVAGSVAIPFSYQAGKEWLKRRNSRR